MKGMRNMIRIAIVEDDREHALRLENALKKYADEHKLTLQICVFYNVISFLEQYAGDYEIVFMDIMMPMMNGMDASRMLREKDENVMLIFVTSMGQYAIRGYEVSASDFIVKPVEYPSFALKFTRALSKLPKKEDRDVLIRKERLLPVPAKVHLPDIILLVLVPVVHKRKRKFRADAGQDDGADQSEAPGNQGVVNRKDVVKDLDKQAGEEACAYLQQLNPVKILS